MLKTNSCPIDAPSEIHREIERKRREIERIMPSNKEVMEEFMKEYNARRWRPVGKRDVLATRFRKMLGRPSKFINQLRAFLNK